MARSGTSRYKKKSAIDPSKEKEEKPKPYSQYSVPINLSSEEKKTSVGPVDAVIRMSGPVRYIWYFTHGRLEKDSCFECAMLSTSHTQQASVLFQKISKFIYFVEIPKASFYQIFKKQQGYQKCFAVKIYKKFAKGKREEVMHQTLFKKQASNLPYSQKNGFCVDTIRQVLILDANCHSFWETGWAKNKHAYYESIISIFVPHLLTKTNSQLPPFIVMRTLEHFWSLITNYKDCGYDATHKNVQLLRNSITRICKFDNMQELRNINTWANASTILAGFGAIMRIMNNARGTYTVPTIDDTSIRCIYEQITNPKVFGKMKDILKNLKRIYDDNNYNTLQSLQNQCWKLQTQSNNQKRFHYILWYNLLCCVKDDPSKWDRRHLIIYNNNIISQKQLNEIIVLDNRLTGQPHPLQNKMWSIIMNSQNTTCKECLNIIEQMEDTNEVLRFVKQYKSSIKMKFKMIRDTWLEFMSIIFQKLSQSPSNELLQSSFNLFQPQIKYMANQNDIPVVFKFYQKHFKFMSKLRVNEKLIQYARYVEHPDFIPLFIDILSPKAKRKKNYKHEIWWKNLKQCTEWWLDAFSLSGTIKILKDNNLEVGIITDIFEQSDKFSIDKYIPPELKSKLEMLLDSKTYDISIRNLVIHTINKRFESLNNAEIQCVKNTASKLLQMKNESIICNEIFKKLIGTFNPFNYEDEKIIKYVTSIDGKNGKQFIKLLISLQKCTHFKELTIKNRLARLVDWWKDKVENIANGCAHCSTVDIVASNNCFNEINALCKEIKPDYMQSKYINAAIKNINNYQSIKAKQNVIDWNKIELKMLLKCYFQQDEYKKQIKQLESNNPKKTAQIDELRESEKQKDELKTNIEQKLQSKTLQSAVELSKGLVIVQDIAYNFNMIKIQLHAQALKLAKQQLMKEKGNEYSKMYTSKTIHNLLFDILIEAYNKVKDRRLLPNTYKQKISTQIVNEGISKHQLSICKSSKETMTSIMLYGMECLSLCCDIALLHNPSVSIEPLCFEPLNKAKIVYDNKYYIEAYGSEKGEHLNFVSWPGIVRNDTNGIVSKKIAVFKNEILKVKIKVK
eukprot:303074_1